MHDIRNFVIIAHIDHGKSTLADRLLEVTGTIESRRMRPQYLDRLELERERGITIKMAPVRMRYTLNAIPYTLNLIDTPGHTDFSYEVSRALHAVEGAILLVDVTKGIQAQTLSTLRAAQQAGLSVIGAVNKIDLFREADGGMHPRVAKTITALAELLRVPPGDIFLVSGKTGEGVDSLLRAVIDRVHPPKQESEEKARVLIFDSLYDAHKGILAFVRVVSGEWRAGGNVHFLARKMTSKLKEVGYFAPELVSCPTIGAGEIGYFATGIKEPDLVQIGDTIALEAHTPALPGYRKPVPVVFIAFYPDGETEFDDLKRALAKLRLNDAALTIEPDANEALGRGLKVGFLGQLHFEITASRLHDEFNLDFLTSFPSVAYRVREKDEVRVVTQAKDLPDHADAVYQPMIRIEVLTPAEYVNAIVNLKMNFDMRIEAMHTMGEYVLITGHMPLAELLRDFDDQLKSLSAGYASFSYELAGEELADVERLETLVAGDIVPALTRVVARKDVEREARVTVERLKKYLPAQQFAQAIQARAGGRIIARETIAAMRKDVTGYLYGGDRSRKMKLWKKQKKGKEKLLGMAKVKVPVSVFREILKK